MNEKENKDKELKTLSDEELDKLAGGYDAHGCPPGTTWVNDISRCVEIVFGTIDPNNKERNIPPV